MAGERIVGKDAFSQGRQPDIKREEDRKEMERGECTQNALTMQALSVETLLLFITDLPPPKKKNKTITNIYIYIYWNCNTFAKSTGVDHDVSARMTGRTKTSTLYIIRGNAKNVNARSPYLLLHDIN